MRWRPSWLTARDDPSPVVAGWPLVASELALAAVTATVIVGLRRLFVSFDFLVIPLTATLTAHALAALSRRARLGILTSLLVSAVGLVLTITWLGHADTTWAMLPTADTWTAFREEASAAWGQFGTVKAPTEALPGFVIGAAVTGWVAATLADMAAFRARTAAEALVPSVTIFVFTSMLAPDWRRLTAASAYLVAAALFLLLFRISHPLQGSVPIGATAARRSPALLRTGLGVGAVAVALAVVIGPLLPGARADEPVLDWKELDGGDDSPRVTLSPLVDTRGRLVEQSKEVLFRVRSDRPALWRISSLELFDGNVWGSRNSFDGAGDDLDSNYPVTDGERFPQLVTIGALSDEWLPAAYAPVSYSGFSAGWDEESSTLIVRGGKLTTPGATYALTSIDPTPLYTPDFLRGLGADVPPDVAERYLELPAGFSPRITELAGQLTQGLDHPYDKALALQNFFLDNFTYSLDVNRGHGTNRMELFVFDERSGYCEQFSGTFAAMARAVGLPARVAVGFTPGEQVSGEWVVRGEHYHAWPEVYIGGHWVYFEPTPGRGAPGAEPYTGVPEQQADANDPNAATTTTAPLSGTLTPDSLPLDVLDPESFGGIGADPGAPLVEDDSNPWVGRVWLTIAAVALLAVLWALTVPLVRRLVRRRRVRRAPTPAAHVEAAWANLGDSLGAAGARPAPAETPHEYVRRAAPQLSLDRVAMRSMADLVDVARYSGSDLDAVVAAEADRLVAALEAELSARATTTERFLREIDPRPLLARR